MNKTQNSNNVILKAKDVFKEYHMGKVKLPVLRGVSLDIKRGEILAIAGASGAGKSTLLHILGLIDTPTNGEVYFKDTSITGLSPKKQAGLRNKIFGFVFQFYHLLPDLNMLENAYLPLMVSKNIGAWLGSKKEIKNKAKTLLGEMGLKERMRHKPSELSGGERQRVAIVRALINNPQILFCDEPTGNLDSKTSEGILEILWQLRKRSGQTIVMVTHNDSLAQRADRILRLADGEII